MNKKKMTPEQIADWKKWLQSNGPYLRGLMIDYFNDLERQIELFITVFFFGDPNLEFNFKPVILERMSFENKRSAFESLLKKLNKSDLKLIQEINSLKKVRNKFAHGGLVIPWNPNDNIITLSSSRDEHNLIGYSEKQYRIFIDRMVAATSTIKQMWRDLYQTKKH